MPKPRKTLDLALGRVAPEPEETSAPVEEVAAPAPATPTKRKPPAAAKTTRSSARMSVYLSEEVHRQLREIAHVEYPVKLNDLVLEGIDLVFKKRGRPSIAELEKATS